MHDQLLAEDRDAVVDLIEPDMRTFVDVECVDESPMLDGTRLCADVGH